MQCQAVTRTGRRCQVTAASSVRDDRGRLMTDPLRRGGRHCALHMEYFCVRTAPVLPKDVTVFYVDLETSGLDVLNDEIRETR